jgi:hypothetical protein
VTPCSNSGLVRLLAEDGGGHHRLGEVVSTGADLHALTWRERQPAIRRRRTSAVSAASAPVP